MGTIFNHAASLAVLAPVFGDTYNRAQAANSKEEFFKSKEAASAAAAWGTSIIGSAVQSYGVGALINATGTLSYKGAAYLGSLIFMASSAPGVRDILDTKCLFANDSARLSRKSSPRDVPWIPSPLALSLVSSRQLVLVCSSPGGEPAPTHSTKRPVLENMATWV